MKKGDKFTWAEIDIMTELFPDTTMGTMHGISIYKDKYYEIWYNEVLEKIEDVREIKGKELESMGIGLPSKPKRIKGKKTK